MIEDKVVSLNEKKRIANDQRELDMCAQGFEVGKLSRLVGYEAVNYTSSLEDLYGSMLAKLEGLARQVEKSNALVNEKVDFSSGYYVFIYRHLELKGKYSLICFTAYRNRVTDLDLGNS